MKSSLLAVSGVLALVVTAACSGSSGAVVASSGADAATGAEPTDPLAGADGGAPVTDGSAPPPPTASPGCGKPGGATGLQQKKITVLGAARQYQLFVPPAYDAAKPARLVFVFHGLGGDGDQIRAYFGFEAEAKGQALFVYPDGLAQAAQGGRTGWAQSDLSFFDALLAEISSSHCVDKKRVFAAGHSFGAYMSNLVGCERADVVSGIAPVSGGLVAAGACKGAVAAWVAHGDRDATVPQSEGITARDQWVTANGCASTTKAISPSPCVGYDGCTAGHPVTWCSFSGGHFPLPAFTKQAIWDFFAAR